MKKPRIYIAGKITGRAISEAALEFKRAAEVFKGAGYEVVNPMELPHDHDKSWESYMKECIAALVTCDEIAMIEGFENSRGAQLELTIALALNLEVYFQTDGLWNYSIFHNK